MGALTTHRTIERSPLIQEKYRVLSEMEKSVASVQTRNWGTIGGNLCSADPIGDAGTHATGVKCQDKDHQRERGEEHFPWRFLHRLLYYGPRTG